MGTLIGIGNALLDALYKVENDQFVKDLGLQKGGMQLLDNERYTKILEAVKSLFCELQTGGSAGNATLCFAKMGKIAHFFGKVRSR